jgi:hypothetical protein
MVEQVKNITETSNGGASLPIVGAVVMAIVSALVVGSSFVVIKYWPQPASVAPYLDFAGGAWWGGVVGAMIGFILGFLTDDKHFS